MTMQFGRDERTGQLGYWDGQKFVPLQEAQAKSGQANIQDLARDPTVTGQRFENISPADRAVVESQMKQGQGAATPTLPGAPLPSQRAAELAQAGGIATAAAQDPQYLAESQQAGKEALPELLKFAAANVAPALLSGGGTAVGAAAIKGGGLLSRLARMAAGGGGGYAGEKINQALGLSEGDETTAGLSAGLGALPGFFRPKVKTLTADERRIQRLVGGEEVGAKAATAKETASKLYENVREGTRTTMLPREVIKIRSDLADYIDLIREKVPNISLNPIITTTDLVDDLKQLNIIAKQVGQKGHTGLEKGIRAKYDEFAKEVRGLPEADIIYGQAKGLERGAKATRTSGEVGVENLLADPKLSGGLTTAQKAFLREQAAKSDKIGIITQALIQSPLGRSMLRLGVSEKGVLKPAAWSAAMQIGARMAGLGEGER